MPDDYEILSVNTLVIGSGAAGLNAAIHFVENGGDSTQIIIVTEQLGGGTSFNAGSDKQTYYKLSLSGSESDSIYKMAETYWKGGSMHGDIALVEAANSIREFMHLISLGVPFPTNRYGEYIGYKTDNDPLQRATSVGPLTSQVMGNALLKRVKELGIKIVDQVYCSKILNIHSRKLVVGLKIEDISKEITSPSEFFQKELIIFVVDNIIAATGGSSAIYQHSVYPESQWGSLGLLIDYGCETQNLTESQFGLASTDFRWNLSGTYQQVIPRYFSCDNNELTDSSTEFLTPHFSTKTKLLNAIFLKGYQWPFRSDRIQNHGSSLIDLLVYKETVEKGRKVFLDFTRNPLNLTLNELLNSLDKEFASYLTKSGIRMSSQYENPIQRLRQINPKAYQLYLSHGIDIEKDPLAISVCVQHCNGGIAGDIWWESSKPNIFVVGEANGSHGVHRPGGAALNSGQVGGLRSSLKIVYGYYQNQMEKSTSIPFSEISRLLENYISQISQMLRNLKNQNLYPSQVLNSIRKRMATYGSIIRNSENLLHEMDQITHQIHSYFKEVKVDDLSISGFLNALRVYDSLLTHAAYLHSIELYLSKNGGSRGSYLVNKAGKYVKCNSQLNQYVIKTVWNHTKFSSHLEAIREIPRGENWFETVWNAYENGSWIY